MSIYLLISLGGSAAAVDTLKTDSKSNRDDLGKISRDIHAAKIVLYVLGGLVTVGAGAITASIGFVGWVIKTYLDYHHR